MRPEERPIDWDNAETMSHFRSLWDSGLSTRLIGEQLGVSKNSVVGKAHRMHILHPEMFAPRPSPIKNIQNRKPSWRDEKPSRRAAASTLPKLGAIAPVKTTVAAIRAHPGKIEPCNYPTETGSWPRYKSCGIMSVPGKPYCAHHCLSCFVAINSKEGKAIRAAWSAVPPVWSSGKSTIA